MTMLILKSGVSFANFKFCIITFSKKLSFLILVMARKHCSSISLSINFIFSVIFFCSKLGSFIFSFWIKSITIYIKAANVGEQIIASKTLIPTGITALSLDLQNVNIKNYIFEDNIQFRVLAIFDATASVDQILKMDETVHVKATLIK